MYCTPKSTRFLTLSNRFQVSPTFSLINTGSQNWRNPRIYSRKTGLRLLISFRQLSTESTSFIQPSGFWNDIANQQRLLLRIGTKLGIEDNELESWYEISTRKFKEQGGGPLLQLHGPSLADVLMAVYPEHKWEVTKFAKRSRSNLKDPKVLVKEVNSLRLRLGIKENDFEAWYKVSTKDVINVGGKAILTGFDSSIPKLLKQVYPEFAWDMNKFMIGFRHKLQDMDHQRRALDGIGEKLGIPVGDFERWYEVTYTKFAEKGGGSLLAKYQGSLLKLLKAVYSEHPWDIRRFASRPRHYWKSDDNVKEFVLQLGEKLGIKHGDYESWYKVGTKEVIKYGGATVLKYNSDSVSKLLKKVFPEHVWDESRFVAKPHAYWKQHENRRKELLSIGEKLGIKEGDFDSWYKITGKDLLEKGGGSLLTYFQHSIANMLKSVFPEHPWDMKRFGKKSQNYWKDPVKVREFMDDLGEKLGVARGTYEGWYDVKLVDLLKGGASAILRYHSNSPASLIASIYPEHKWEFWRFARKGRAQEGPEQALLDNDN